MATLGLTVNKSIDDFVTNYVSESGLSRSAAIRQLLSSAIESGEKAMPTSNGETRVLRFSVSSTENDWYSECAKEKGRGRDVTKWLAGVLSRNITTNYLRAQNDSKTHKKDQPKDFVQRAGSLFSRHTTGLELRKEQQDYLGLLLKSIHQRKIVMAEASTGVGKGIAILLAGLDAAKNGHRVVITAPTIQIIRQLVSQYSDMEKCLDYSVLLGRGEFVSRSRLKALLEDNPNIEHANELTSWIENEGEPKEQSVFNISWLAETLIDIAPNFPVRDVTLPRVVTERYHEDPGYLTYKSLFVTAGETNIIFCSHAMVASDINIRDYNINRDDEIKEQVKNSIDIAKLDAAKKLINETENDVSDEQLQAVKNKAIYETLTDVKASMEGVIPGGYDCILVDEAQELERVIASSVSLDLSVYRLYYNARCLSKLLGTGHAKIKRIYNELVKMGANNKKEKRFSKQSFEHQKLIELGKSIRVLFSELKKQNKKGGAPESELRAQLSELDKLNYQLTRNNRISTVQWTPVKRYPRFIVGPQSVDRQLEVLWRSVSSGAVISASLYLPAPHNHAHMARVLNLSDHQLLISKPIVTSWLTKPVTIHLPEEKENEIGRLWLRYPGSEVFEIDRSDQMLFWADEVTKVLMRITKRAEGGTLILGTAYESNKEIYTRLIEGLGDRLIVQEKGERFEILVQRYKNQYYEGKRPVLLALGRAWTGLDLTDNRRGVAAKNDHMISDLAVLRIPFGLNQSSTHLNRKKYQYVADALESALMFKQGLGRLVRRRGVPEKNIWILDPRISSKINKHCSDTRFHRDLLSNYKNFKVIKRES